MASRPRKSIFVDTTGTGNNRPTCHSSPFYCYQRKEGRKAPGLFFRGLEGREETKRSLAVLELEEKREGRKGEKQKNKIGIDRQQRPKGPPGFIGRREGGNGTARESHNRKEEVYPPGPKTSGHCEKKHPYKEKEGFLDVVVPDH